MSGVKDFHPPSESLTCPERPGKQKRDGIACRLYARRYRREAWRSAAFHIVGEPTQGCSAGRRRSDGQRVMKNVGEALVRRATDATLLIVSTARNSHACGAGLDQQDEDRDGCLCSSSHDEVPPVPAVTEECMAAARRA
jgi:hypothetical protein